MDAAERQQKESIRLLTPKGMELALAVEDIYLSPDCVRCAIRKDSGDDPDITRDTLIYAEVRKQRLLALSSTADRAWAG